MAAFTVREKGQADRLYTLNLPKVVIGRSRKAQLVLPNSSVSRQHAQIIRSGDEFMLVDLDSQNGTLVNGRRVMKHVLRHGDQVQLGKFTLLFQTAEQIRGSASLSSLESYSPKDVRSASGLTDYVALAELERLRQMSGLLADAEVLGVGTKRGQWRPGDKPLVFGGRDGIAVDGVPFGGLGGLVGALAEIIWDGRRHVLRRVSRLATLTANNTPVTTQQPLGDGTTFVVGKSTFVYRVNAPD